MLVFSVPLTPRMMVVLALNLAWHGRGPREQVNVAAKQDPPVVEKEGCEAVLGRRSCGRTWGQNKHVRSFIWETGAEDSAPALAEPANQPQA